MRQHTIANVPLNVRARVYGIRVQAAVDAATCSRCKHFTEHQLRRRSGNKHTHLISTGHSSHTHTHHQTDICTVSPYLVDLQRWAFVTHGHRAEHHLSEHVSIWWAPWGALTQRKKEQSTQVWICKSSTQGCVICILHNNTLFECVTRFAQTKQKHVLRACIQCLMKTSRTQLEWSRIQDMKAKNPL